MSRAFLTLLFFATLAFSQESKASTISTSAPKERFLLSCSEVRSRVNLFLDLHIRFNDFSDELSKRSLSKLFEVLDPEKNFFISSDIESFSPLADRLDGLILRGNCAFIDSIHKVFTERVRDRLEKVEAQIEFASKQEITQKSLTFSHNTVWGKTNTELDDKWLQKIRLDGAKIRKNTLAEFPKARLLRRYQRSLTRLLSQNHDEVFSHFLNAFALSLDPHSGHFLPAAQDEFSSHLGIPLDGVGLTLTDEEDVIAVESIEKDSPADRSKQIRVGDVLLSVDTLEESPPQDVSKFDVLRINRMLRGKKGTKVKLEFTRRPTPPLANSVYHVTLVRDSSRLKSIKIKSEILTLRGRKIGLLRLPSFYTDSECSNRVISNCHGASAETRTEIENLKKEKIEGIVLDLRNNSGGDLQESIRFAGLFLGKGPILQAVDRSGIPRIQSDPDPRVQFTSPLVLLVNKNSASASEIVTAAFKDYSRAIVVGDSRTFGKGSIQVLQDLTPPLGKTRAGMIKITQAKFYGPKGNSTQNRGVDSDITIPSLSESEVETEDKKDFVLEWDQIRIAPGFRSLGNLSDLIKIIRKKSEERIREVKPFATLKEQILRANSQELPQQTIEPFSEENWANPDDLQLHEAAEILVDALEAPPQIRMPSISSYDL